MKKYFIFVSAPIVKIGLYVFLGSCLILGASSCSCTEDAISELYDVRVDLDGDGDRGDRSGQYNPSFTGSPSRTGHCRDCGLDHYGNYKCSAFTPIRPGSTTCSCGCSIKDHAVR